MIDVQLLPLQLHLLPLHEYVLVLLLFDTNAMLVPDQLVFLLFRIRDSFWAAADSFDAILDAFVDSLLRVIASAHFLYSILYFSWPTAVRRCRLLFCHPKILQPIQHFLLFLVHLLRERQRQQYPFPGGSVGTSGMPQSGFHHDSVTRFQREPRRLPFVHAVLWRGGQPLPIWKTTRGVRPGDESCRSHAFVQNIVQRHKQCYNFRQGGTVVTVTVNVLRLASLITRN